VLHEVAHVEEGGHDEDFQRVLIELAQWADLGD
jgi:predicted metal-dependent hydrolase